ncbi:MAG: hypothetical protein WD231_00590 [Candidatus Woykebacteria bacterium]
MASIVTLIAAIVNTLAILFYLFISSRINTLYSDLEINKPNPLTQYWPVIMFLLFAFVSWWFWFFLKGKSKQGVKVGYGLIVSLALLIGPFLIFYLVGVYANILMENSIQNTFK